MRALKIACRAVLALVACLLIVGAILAHRCGQPIAAGLLALCAILVILPSQWDPAIRIKERQIARGEHPEA